MKGRDKRREEFWKLQYGKETRELLPVKLDI